MKHTFPIWSNIYCDCTWNAATAQLGDIEQQDRRRPLAWNDALIQLNSLFAFFFSRKVRGSPKISKPPRSDQRHHFFCSILYVISPDTDMQTDLDAQRQRWWGSPEDLNTLVDIGEPRVIMEHRVIDGMWVYIHPGLLCTYAISMQFLTQCSAVSSLSTGNGETFHLARASKKSSSQVICEFRLILANQSINFDAIIQ